MFSKRSQRYSLRFFLSVLLAISITITSITPVFAANSTPSAFRVSKTSPLNSAILAASDTASNVFINGYTTGRTTWAYLNYNDSLAYFYNTPSTLPDLFSHLADAIARDFLQVNSNIRSIMDDVDTIRNNSGTIKTSVSNINTAVNNIQSYIDDIATSTDISTAASSIVSAIENNSLIVPQELIDDVDSINTKTPSQDYFWKKFLTNTGGQIPTMSQGGVFRQQAFDFGSNSLLGGIEGLLYYGLTGATNGISLIVRDVRDNNAALDDYLYASDLSTSLIPRTTVWQNMRDFWSNTSMHLSRLAYVLASDADIQARQDAAETTQAAFNSFIKPTGSASVSGSDVGILADIGSNVIDNMNTGVNASDSLGVFNESAESWSWFTQDTANAFDTTGNNRTNNSLRSKSTSETPYLDAYYAEVMGHVR